MEIKILDLSKMQMYGATIECCNEKINLKLRLG